MSNSFVQNHNSFEDSVRRAVNRQLHNYPLSTLKDLYKNFFQDTFGPGHLINDAQSAKNHLIRELNSYSEIKGIVVEPTGFRHNFYRINLSVLKENKVDFDIFFNAFIESSAHFVTVDIEIWKKEWHDIESVIQSMNLNLIDFEIEHNEIIEQLNNGRYVCHHSDIYTKSYDPHYRIISSNVYHSKLRSLIEPDKE